MRKRLNGILQLSDINHQWYYDNIDIPQPMDAPPLLNPHIARPCGHPIQTAWQPGPSSRRAAQEPESSTRQKPSAFEMGGRVTRSISRSQGLAVRSHRVVGGATAIAAKTIMARKAQQEKAVEEESAEEN
ncbi:MAG: hypothetical protein M1829_001467 [Trizodia sp. TS-e1964]|nr:MAG: hypothetical protein M1829_001467 [Trizodia sp. TS-e1964]